MAGAAFVLGVLLHACVAMAILDAGDGREATPAQPSASATPEATPAPDVLPDRTDCEEIRGTEYRSLTERDFFRANCILGRAPGGAQEPPGG